MSRRIKSLGRRWSSISMPRVRSCVVAMWIVDQGELNGDLIEGTLARSDGVKKGEEKFQGTKSSGSLDETALAGEARNQAGGKREVVCRW